MALFDLLKKVQKVVDAVSSAVDSQLETSRQQRSSRAETTADHIPFGAPAKDAPTPAVPVTFMLLQGGIPRLAIIVCGSSEYRTRRIQATVDACQQLQIPVQRYYREFRNDADYVTQRVRSGLLGN